MSGTARSDTIPLIPLQDGYSSKRLSRASSRSTDTNSPDDFPNEDQPLLDGLQYSTESTDSETPRNQSNAPRSSVTIRNQAASTLGRRTMWVTMRSVQIKTLLYSSLVAVMITMLAFGYDMGFSSPTLHDLDQNNGKHTYFDKTIYHDVFNVSDNVLY